MSKEKRISPGPISDQIAGTLRQLREAQRLTYTELSERLAALGRPIPVLGLRRIEQGDRRVDLDDLAALAHVLGIPPILLVAPIATEASITVLGVDMDAWHFAQWFAGREPFIGTAYDEGDYGAFVEGSVIIRLRVQHDASVKECLDLLMEVRGWEDGILSAPLGVDDPEPAAGEIRDRALDAIGTPAAVPAEVRRRQQHAEAQLRLTRSLLRQRGYRVPDLPEDLRHIDDRAIERHEMDEGFYYLQTPAPEQSA